MIYVQYSAVVCCFTTNFLRFIPPGKSRFDTWPNRKSCSFGYSISLWLHDDPFTFRLSNSNTDVQVRGRIKTVSLAPLSYCKPPKICRSLPEEEKSVLVHPEGGEYSVGLEHVTVAEKLVTFVDERCTWSQRESPLLYWSKIPLPCSSPAVDDPRFKPSQVVLPVLIVDDYSRSIRFYLGVK